MHFISLVGWTRCGHLARPQNILSELDTFEALLNEVLISTNQVHSVAVIGIKEMAILCKSDEFRVCCCPHFTSISLHALSAV